MLKGFAKLGVADEAQDEGYERSTQRDWTARSSGSM